MGVRATILGFVCALAAWSAGAATFTVTNTAAGGAGSLFEAIENSNMNGSAVADVIEFDIPGAGVHTIAVPSELPTILTPVVIDGYTQDGASPNTLAVGSGSNAVILIAIDGVNNTFPGLQVFSTANGSTIRGLAVQRFNVGIYVGGATSVSISGNFIGTDASGTAAAGNDTGILFENADGNSIGLIAPATRNLISGNTVGLNLGSGSSANTVAGNLIGSAKDGLTALGNETGIDLGANGNFILDNLLSGNVSGSQSAGIRIEGAEGNTIAGNFIGTTATGTGSIPNRYGIVVAGGLLLGGGYDNTIGVLNEPNVIENNLEAGVAFLTTNASGNRIEYNVFRANGGLAIDFQDDGPTLNDPLDADSGANLSQNFPVITSAVQAETNAVAIAGTLHSTPSSEFKVQLHYTGTCDASGYGEGAHVADTTVSTDASGNGAFNVNLPFLPSGGFLTATATDADGNTSEFSLCVALVAAPPVPTVDLAITKQGPSTIAPGGSAQYTITVANNGTGPATNVLVEDDLPPSLTLASAQSSQGSCTGTANIDCALGTLNAGATATVTLIVTASMTEQSVTNTASVSATETDANGTNNSSTANSVIASAMETIPTLSEVGLALALAALALAAVLKLR